MSYNFHLPLILSPNDIWLVVLQGFKVHMLMNKDKEYMKLSFKEIDKFHENAVKYLKIKDEKLPEDLSKVPDEEFEATLFDTVEKAMKKMWGDKHLSSDFAANP